MGLGPPLDNLSVAKFRFQKTNPKGQFRVISPQGFHLDNSFPYSLEFSTLFHQTTIVFETIIDLNLKKSPLASKRVRNNFQFSVLPD